MLSFNNSLPSYELKPLTQSHTTLQHYVEELSLIYFHRPFQHVAIWNSRLQTTGGRYHLKTHDLDFNPKIFEQYGEVTFRGIVKHELCHYHLHLQHKGYQHKDKDFKQWLLAVGGLRYAPTLKKNIPSYDYQCTYCQMRYSRYRRVNLKKKVCGNCHHPLQLIKK